MRKSARPLNAAVCGLALFIPAAATADLVTGGFIYDGNRFNWGPSGIATQSTTDFGGVAIRAIDGNTNGDYSGVNSTSHSGDTPFNFWQVDLGIDRPIQEIVIWNRADCCGDRLSNFRLSVTDALDAVVFSQDFYVGVGSVGLNEVVTLPSTVNGKVVKVEFLAPGVGNTGSPYLSLAEVELFSAAPFSYSNVAVGKSTNMSSEGFGGTSSRAVDGNTNGNWGSGSVTHTADASPGPVFWEVDLGGDFNINDISLWNRTDCCGTRLSNFRLSVFDGGTEVWGQDFFTDPGTNAGPVFSILENSGGFFATGDRVRVELIGGVNGSSDPVGGGKDILSLAEVQVFGQAVPEPSVALALFGGMGILIARRRRR